MDAVASVLIVLPGVFLAIALTFLVLDNELTASGLLAAGIGVALLAASGLDRLASIVVDAVAALDAAQGLKELDSSKRADSARRSRSRVSPGLDRIAGVPDDLVPEDDDVLVRVSNVTSTFGDGQGLVTPVDLLVREGDRILLSAPSGFGKTTLGEVLAGERTPTTGAVWRRKGIIIARVLQSDDDHVFGASLLFNLTCRVEWPPSVPTQDLVDALVIELGLSDLVRTMPAGLAQSVGEGGLLLSTGERARVSLAAALLQKPDLLILDESIAALDGRTRELVLAACERHSKASLLFAHWD